MVSQNKETSLNDFLHFEIFEKINDVLSKLERYPKDNMIDNLLGIPDTTSSGADVLLSTRVPFSAQKDRLQINGEKEGVSFFLDRRWQHPRIQI